jgi:hypothetical protein
MEHQLSRWQKNKLDTKLSLKPVFFFPKQELLCGITDRQFQQNSSVLEQQRLQAASVLIDQNTDAQWQCKNSVNVNNYKTQGFMKTYFQFRWRLQLHGVLIQ